MNKLNVAVLAVVLAVLGGCANTSGSMVGTSGVVAGGPFIPASIPHQLWTNDD
jgi:hypothetical protein